MDPAAVQGRLPACPVASSSQVCLRYGKEDIFLPIKRTAQKLFVYVDLMEAPVILHGMQK